MTKKLDIIPDEEWLKRCHTPDPNPQSYYGGANELWVCVFPGKMGISWKKASFHSPTTKEEAEREAASWANVIAVPLAFWLRYKDYESRMVAAEQKLVELGFREEIAGGAILDDVNVVKTPF